MGRFLVILLTLGFVTDGRRWDPPVCRLDSATLPPEWQAVTATAREAWNNVSSMFRFEEERGQNAVVCFNMGRWDYRLALTQTVPADPDSTLREARTLLNTFVRFDPPHPDERGNTETYDLRTVITHELGHMIVLGHSSDPAALMYYGIHPGLQMDVGQDDIEGVTYLYGR